MPDPSGVVAQVKSTSLFPQESVNTLPFTSPEAQVNPKLALMPADEYRLSVLILNRMSFPASETAAGDLISDNVMMQKSPVKSYY